ncbi:TPA: hypothetical protein ACUI23_001806 [Staphylococcus pseudintermedius]
MKIEEMGRQKAENLVQIPLFNEKVNKIHIKYNYGTHQFVNNVERYPNCLDLTLGQSDFPVTSYVQRRNGSVNSRGVIEIYT